MEKTAATDLSKTRGILERCIYETADYEVRIIQINVGPDPAYPPLARKYAVVHKQHEVIGMVTELLPTAIAAAEGLQASLENARSGDFQTAAKLPGVVN